jgi:uncharacterized protein (TIGR03437 family)
MEQPAGLANDRRLRGLVALLRMAKGAPGVRLVLLLIAAVGFGSGAAPGNFQTHYINLGPGDESVAIAGDAAGNIFILSIFNSGSGSWISKTDAQGNFVKSYDLPSPVNGNGGLGYGGGRGADLVVDSAGNVVVLENVFLANSVPVYGRGGSGAFVFKLDNNLTRVLASATLGNPATADTGGIALALDAADNVYVTGQTWAPDFPVTPGAYDSTRPPLSIANGGPVWDTDAFITEFSSDLSKIIYSTLYGDSTVCNSNFPGTFTSTCSLTSGARISVNSDGSVILAGTSNSPSLRNSSQNGPATYGFVAKFSAGLGSLEGFATLGPAGVSGLTVRGMALDSEGDVLVVGSSTPGLSFSGAIQPSVPGVSGGYVAEFDAGLQGLKWGTYFGGSNLTGFTATVNGIALDPSGGNIWITGFSLTSELPGAMSTDTFFPYIAELAPDGSSLTTLTETQGFQGQAVAYIPGGALAVLAASDSFMLSAPPDQLVSPTVTNAANSQSSGTIEPAELISLYGAGIGPASPLGGQVVNGAFATRLGGYQVLFNGTPSPLLYAKADQINVVAPVEIAGQQTVTIQVIGPQGATASPALVFVAAARPQLFEVVINQDGTVNSDAFPAPSGSIVTLWATGTGLPSGQFADGTLGPVSPPYGTIPLTVVLSAFSLSPPLLVEYAGQAPGEVLGLTQINVQLPAQVNVPVLNVNIEVDGVFSGIGVIYAKP